MMRRLPLLLIAAVVLLSADCQATGMGWIPSVADPTQKATFGFVFAYDGTTHSFSGAYHDKAAGVDLKGSGVLKKMGPPDGKRINGVCLSGPAEYVSTNRDFPGEGWLELTVCDEEGGFLLGDFIMISVMSGPYAIPPFLPAYTNFGSPSGNITVSCRENDCA